MRMNMKESTKTLLRVGLLDAAAFTTAYAAGVFAASRAGWLPLAAIVGHFIANHLYRKSIIKATKAGVDV